LNMTAQQDRVLINKIDTKELLLHPAFDFEPAGTDNPPVIPEDIYKENRTLLKNCKIIVFLGTWCGDSQALIPEIYYYFQGQLASADDIIYYGLDETKM